MKYEVELASARATRAYSEDQENTLSALVTANSGEYTYQDIAAKFEGGAFTAKSVQGKILSMELTEHVKAAPKAETVRTYSPAEEVIFVQMVKAGAFVEAIAEKLGRTINSVRGKALSLLRAEEIDGMPKQEFTKGAAKEDVFAALTNIAEMTVEAIAEAVDKSPRGVRTMLTRRGVKAADYDGAAKKAKAAATTAAA